VQIISVRKSIVVGFEDLLPPGGTIIYVVPYREHDDQIELITIFHDEYWQKRYGEIL
jgi:hypothetical protein